MSEYIARYGDSMCYIDTDGIKCTDQLDSSEVGEALGMMKYEGMFTESVYLAPKVYGGVSADLSMVVKIKGLKYGAVSYWGMKTLLYNDTVKLANAKWSRM
jgi:hypothetical protein